MRLFIWRVYMMKYFATEYVVRRSWFVYWVVKRYPEESYSGLGHMNVVFREKKLKWFITHESAKREAHRLQIDENYKKKHYTKKKGTK